MLESAAKPIFSSGASEPPAMTTSASPLWIMRRPSRKQMTLEAQAATWVMTGPVKPYSMESWQAAMEPDRAGMAKGLTKRAPLVLMVSCPSMTCSMPPPEVFTATATRSRCSGLQSDGVEARVRHGFLGGGHAEVDEAAHPPRHLGVHGDRGVEALDLGGDAHVEVRGIEVGDGSAAAHAGHGIGPERGVVVADGCDGAQAGHDGAT